MKIDHIGIAIKDLQSSNALFSLLLGEQPYKTEEVVDQKVKVSFYQCGPTKLELLESLSGDGPIARFIRKRGEGIHHLAFRVKDIYQSMVEMEAKGFKLIDKKPRKGADNKLICFLHPKFTNGVLIELCQKIDEETE